jgi:hypothetical protein
MSSSRHILEGSASKGDAPPVGREEVFGVLDNSAHALNIASADDAPQIVVEAAGAFENRHHARARRADAALLALRRDLTSHSKASAFEALTENVRRNRFFMIDRYDPFQPVVRESRARVSRKTKWRLQDSCFAPRARAGNTKVSVV